MLRLVKNLASLVNKFIKGNIDNAHSFKIEAVIAKRSL